MTRKLHLTKKERNKLISYFERLFLCDYYRQHDPRRLSTCFFPDIQKIFWEKIAPVIGSNPGILQKSFYKDKSEDEKQKLSSIFYFSGKIGFIKRRKRGNTYALYLLDNISQEDFIKWYLDFHALSTKEPTNILVETYPDSEKMIIDYFGKDFLKILFKHSGGYYEQWRAYNKEFGNLHDAKDGRRTIYPEEPYLFGKKEDNYYVDSFLASLGACLRFNMNDSLREIVSKYWTKECERGLKKFYFRYGFFADYAFVYRKLENILGDDKLKRFNAELEEEALSFKIKWCGFIWDNIGISHIIWNYVQSLKFKWELKPESRIKKCIYCGDSFNPVYLFRLGGFDIVKYYPIDNSIEEVNFCRKHFPPSSHGISPSRNEDYNEKEMGISLKKLADILEFIPPNNFHTSLEYLEGINKQKFETAIKLINDMPPFEKIISSQPKGYKDIFGSWLKALDAAGILEGGVRKTSRGYICLAKDGHECRSIGEKIIDDYLYMHNIPHDKEPHYPGEKGYRADWKIGKYLVEFWGLMGNEDYDRKMEEKRNILREHNISLIEITSMDLRKLDVKFKKLNDKCDR